MFRHETNISRQSFVERPSLQKTNSHTKTLAHTCKWHQCPACWGLFLSVPNCPQAWLNTGQSSCRWTHTRREWQLQNTEEGGLQRGRACSTTAGFISSSGDNGGTKLLCPLGISSDGVKNNVYTLTCPIWDGSETDQTNAEICCIPLIWRDYKSSQPNSQDYKTM